jgi:hypothetical protein
MEPKVSLLFFITTSLWSPPEQNKSNPYTVIFFTTHFNNILPATFKYVKITNKSSFINDNMMFRFSNNLCYNVIYVFRDRSYKSRTHLLSCDTTISTVWWWSSGPLSHCERPALSSSDFRFKVIYIRAVNYIVNITSEIKYRRESWMGKRHVRRRFGGNTWRKESICKRRSIWQDNIKTDLQGIDWEGIY